MKKVTVVIPSKNERNAILGVIKSIPTEKLIEVGYEVNILIIDSSTDDTPNLAREAGAKVIHEHRPGYGRAYKTGFGQAEGDIIATVDADMTYPIEKLAEFVEILDKEGIDFLNTNRFGDMEKGAMSPVNRFGNYVLNLAIRLIFGMQISDSQSGMWVFRKKLLDNAVLRSDSMAFSEELKLEARYFLKARWKEIPIHYKNRTGKAKLNVWKHGTENLLFLLGKRFQR